MGFRTPEQRRRYLQNRYQQRIQQCRALLGGKCVKCGCTEKLEFDHIDPLTKTASISRLLANGNKADLEKELQKCQLLCNSCHVAKTAEKKENVTNVKSWLITKKDSSTVVCTNLSQWCKDNGYKEQVLRDIARNRRSLKCDIAFVVKL